MSNLLIMLLLLTPNPNPGNCQPQSRNTRAVEKHTITATAYCLKGHTSSGPRTHEVYRCIALRFSFNNCMFGAIVVIDGLGEFTFADIMPPQWRKRVDVWQPTSKACHRFGLKKGRKIWVKVRTRPREIRLARLNR